MKSPSSVEIYSLATIGGIAITTLGSFGLIGSIITSIGGILTLSELIRGFNPYRRLFESTKLIVGEKIPRYLGKKNTAYGYILIFSLPTGLSSDDFIKKQKAIEENLNREIEITYHDHKIFMKVFEKQLEKAPKFKLIETKKLLELPIGIIFGGEIITLDLEKVVHLLIAGETGSGKSTVLRGILTSLIASNKKLVLHLVDLKNGAEFNVFRKSSKVRSFSRNIEDTRKILFKLLDEVDRRYDIFFENNVVDIKEYNRLGRGRLDYQILVVDEFADLQDENDCIRALETLAAKARACGIHLIISTQRPDMKILNGRIKANIPCILGLKTMNGTNSRIIIDENGLEKLRGKGHGLLKYGELTEFQSMYLDVKEARDLVKHTYKKEILVQDKNEIEDFSFLEAIK